MVQHPKADTSVGTTQAQLYKAGSRGYVGPAQERLRSAASFAVVLEAMNQGVGPYAGQSGNPPVPYTQYGTLPIWQQQYQGSDDAQAGPSGWEHAESDPDNEDQGETDPEAAGEGDASDDGEEGEAIPEEDEPGNREGPAAGPGPAAAAAAGGSKKEEDPEAAQYLDRYRAKGARGKLRKLCDACRDAGNESCHFTILTRRCHECGKANVRHCTFKAYEKAVALQAKRSKARQRAREIAHTQKRNMEAAKARAERERDKPDTEHERKLKARRDRRHEKEAALQAVGQETPTQKSNRERQEKFSGLSPAAQKEVRAKNVDGVRKHLHRVKERNEASGSGQGPA
ncbi:hypothetical protein PG997_008864 [Apiospora hydei]|uniref:Zn(2)-C6 fungal-type domain-containing protein n=1 Tax=Apiospora hydei TaxID=1337664 RepID=A0ABR1WBZ4_9PEZI